MIGRACQSCSARYVSARLHGHLDLLCFFPAVLIIWGVEWLISGAGLARWRGCGLRLGVLAVVQLLFYEEILVLTVVIAATVGVVLLLKHQEWGATRHHGADGDRGGGPPS